MGIELDELLYTTVLRYFKKRKLNNTELLKRQVLLSEIHSRLIILSRALSEVAIEIFPAEREGGYKDNNFFLPSQFSIFHSKEDNLTFYIFRIAYLSIQRQLNLNWTETENTEEQSQQKAKETAPIVLERLFSEYPNLQQWYERTILQLPIRNKKNNTIDDTWLFGKWMKNSDNNFNKPLKNISDKVQQIQNSIEAQKIVQAHAVEEITSLTIDKKQQEDYVLMHSFEKIETAEAFNGNWRDFDGEDELENHQEALEEMKMNFTVRVDDMVHSIYQADFIENTSVAESHEFDSKGYFLKYNEWNYKNRSYLIDFCKVYPKTQNLTNSTYYHNTIDKHKTTLHGLRKTLCNINNKMLQERKQLQGESFDLDAITDRYADLFTGVSPDENIYLSKRKRSKDLAILILLDISLSSDGYASGNRVIDIEKEASILFGEILNEFNIEFAIDGFFSKTRNHTTYLTLKDFHEKWNTARNKIGPTEPGGYTRIGPALRHAGARISNIDARNKWVILLSDGKPNDYDKYEGQYGIRDTKMALSELNKSKINTYALAIESQAKYYLPQMFGQNHYQILTSPQNLIHSLAKLFTKIKYH
ncbi:MAG: VWA domain-containing protein [Cytophagaceae bacterium]